MPPKRFRTAWLFAVLSSFVAVGLAIVPNFPGSYDPILAVLTLTVIAAIWYTYFSYCGVHREPLTVLQLQVQGVMYVESAQLNPTILNLSPRTVVATLHLTVSVDDDEAPSEVQKRRIALLKQIEEKTVQERTATEKIRKLDHKIKAEEKRVDSLSEIIEEEESQLRLDTDRLRELSVEGFMPSMRAAP